MRGAGSGDKRARARSFPIFSTIQLSIQCINCGIQPVGTHVCCRWSVPLVQALDCTMSPSADALGASAAKPKCPPSMPPARDRGQDEPPLARKRGHQRHASLLAGVDVPKLACEAPGSGALGWQGAQPHLCRWVHGAWACGKCVLGGRLSSTSGRAAASQPAGWARCCGPAGQRGRRRTSGAPQTRACSGGRLSKGAEGGGGFPSSRGWARAMRCGGCCGATGVPQGAGAARHHSARRRRSRGRNQPAAAGPHAQPHKLAVGRCAAQQTRGRTHAAPRHAQAVRQRRRVASLRGSGDACHVCVGAGAGGLSSGAQQGCSGQGS